MLENETYNKTINFRTDLASERRDLYIKANKIENEINGVESEKKEIDEKIAVEKVKITNEEGEKAIRKANRKLYNNRYKKSKISTRR